jgi:UBA/TS-N domain
LGVSQANIDQITGMGLDFTREQVVNALRASFDNPDHAVDILLGVRFSFLFFSITAGWA